jgi:beta-glucosidase/6-phospho-beta-glucosidase/beta-galactosidase
LIESLGQSVDRWVTFESIGQEIIYGYGDKNYPPSRFDYPQSTSHIFTAAGNIMKTHKFIYDKFKNAGIQNVGIGIEALEYSQPADHENQKDIDASKRHNDFNIGLFLEPLFTGEYPESIQKLRDAPTPPSGLLGACDFIVYSYETTGLVTWMDGLYNVTLADDYWRFGAIDFCISNPEFS